MAREFVDTNILVYAFSNEPKTEAARAILQRRCAIGVQSLNEFTNVARRKMAMEWAEVDEILKAVRLLSSKVLPLDLDIHENAVELSKRYSFSIFDALLIAAALKADCRVFYSEDMQHGMLVEDRLRIVNPFIEPLPGS